MTDNPFSEPEDSDRTIIRPMPGGKKPAAPAAPPPGPSPFDAPSAPYTAPQPAAPQYAPQPAPRAASDAPETIGMGGSPLIAAAGPLLQLLARLRTTLNAPDSGDPRDPPVRGDRPRPEHPHGTAPPRALRALRQPG
jgi:type VI secretion system protein ImpK